MQVKFKNSETIYESDYRKVGNIIILTNVPQNTSGFYVYGKHENDFTDFTTIYRVMGNTVQFSCDGSVYVEPKIIENEIDDDVIPTPTLDERVSALEDAVVEIMEVI